MDPVERRYALQMELFGATFETLKEKEMMFINEIVDAMTLEDVDNMEDPSDTESDNGVETDGVMDVKNEIKMSPSTYHSSSCISTSYVEIKCKEGEAGVGNETTKKLCLLCHACYITNYCNIGDRNSTLWEFITHKFVDKHCENSGGLQSRCDVCRSRLWVLRPASVCVICRPPI